MSRCDRFFFSVEWRGPDADAKRAVYIHSGVGYALDGDTPVRGLHRLYTAVLPHQPPVCYWSWGSGQAHRSMIGVQCSRMSHTFNCLSMLWCNLGTVTPCCDKKLCIQIH